jgi:hypothetical protein
MSHNVYIWKLLVCSSSLACRSVIPSPQNSDHFRKPLSRSSSNCPLFWSPCVHLADPTGHAVCGHLVAGIAGSNAARGMDVCPLCLYVVLSCEGRGLCDVLITRAEESYRVSNFG